MLEKSKYLAADFIGLPRLVSDSAAELKNLRSLTGSGLLSALSVILNQFTIFFSQVLRVSFTFLPIALSGMLYGPVLTGSLGAVVDILKYFTRNDGGAFFPGFTISEFIVGFLYGLFLYRKRVTLPRVFMARLTVTVVNNLFLTPLWLSMLYGDAFVALVAARIVKNIIMLPIETALLYVILKQVSALRLPSRNYSA